jgi:hypothetical protein
MRSIIETAVVSSGRKRPHWSKGQLVEDDEVDAGL